MFLKKLKIRNYRKFSSNDCALEFVSHDKYSENKIAGSTTLIVGKNNSGKTTVTHALQKIIESGKSVRGSDFNYIYLQKILNQCLVCSRDLYPLPRLEFEILVCVNADAENSLNNIKEFVTVEEFGEEETLNLTINLKLEIVEVEKFKNELEKLIKKYPILPKLENLSQAVLSLLAYKSFSLSRDKIERRRAILFKKFVDLITKTQFEHNCYNLAGEMVDSKKFNIANLISVKVINANTNLHDKNLSNIFNKIIKNRYLLDSEIEKLEELQDEIDTVNSKITDKVSSDHNKSVNGVLHQIEFHKRLGINLSASLDFDKLTRDLIRHEYTEQGFFIPEGQFGLGYTNLMNIIGEIIDYVEKYPAEGVQSKVNLICIEEPEAFMHPQMQESFIKYINNAVKYLLESSGKSINSQLIITTHSSHILNSKIHCSNSFNNINYILQNDKCLDVLNLSDDVLSGDEIGGEEAGTGDEVEKKKNDLKFLKKHIKYKVSELFFADAIIFVEGVTEETLLSYYLEKNETLSKCYISILNINGAHGQVYLPLVKALKIPTLIITDIDIKRNDNEKYEVITTPEGEKKIEKFTQIDTLEERESTNSTIHKFNGASTGLNQYFESNNIYGVFQKDRVSGYFASSFEEAYILQNSGNKILNDVLKATKPRIYQEIVGESEDTSNLISNSYKIQKKLSDCKSEFANNLLYEFLVSENQADIPELPAYIKDGLSWLEAKMGHALGRNS